MITENDFQATLDVNPEDHHTRLVFADWLEEQCDPRADGYRALGAKGHRPANWQGFWGWMNESLFPEYREEQPVGSVLPDDWYAELPRGGQFAVEHDTRRQAEDAAAIAFAKLPLERRAELLTAPETKT